ncbi:MAG: AAA family ATPase, partial [Mixta calida]|nr:AAA family ATPase [Mixta calida]
LFQFREEVDEYFSEVRRILMLAKDRLDERRLDIFQKITPVTIDKDAISSDSLVDTYQSLLKENKDHTSHLAGLRTEALEKLKSDRIAVLKQEFDLTQLQKDLDEKQTTLNNAEAVRGKKFKREKDILRRIANLRAKMLDEGAAVDSINKVLRNSCSVPFELVRLESQGKGYYLIRDIDSSTNRDVSKLSTGELNLIAFLYFTNLIQKPTSDGRRKIVIFDDPMNSNDSTYQFIILSTLNSLLEKAAKKYEKNSTIAGVVVLTHNVNFYLNVIPYRLRNYDEPYSIYILSKDFKRTEVKRIKSQQENIKTSYEALWSDLVFAHENQRPNLMWNIFRRIVGSYLLFNGFDATDVARTEANKEAILGSILKKSMDVSSHEILDFEAESGNATVNEIKKYAEGFFVRRGSKNHFSHYWNRFSK